MQQPRSEESGLEWWNGQNHVSASLQHFIPLPLFVQHSELQCRQESKCLTSLATSGYIWATPMTASRIASWCYRRASRPQPSLQCRAHAEWQTTIHSHINTHGPFRLCARLNVRVFGQWEEAGVAGGKEELTPHFVKIPLSRNHLHGIWLRASAQWSNNA